MILSKEKQQQFEEAVDFLEWFGEQVEIDAENQKRTKAQKVTENLRQLHIKKVQA